MYQLFTSVISSSPRADGDELRNELEHCRVVEVEAGDGVLTRGLLRLLDDAQRPCRRRARRRRGGGGAPDPPGARARCALRAPDARSSRRTGLIEPLEDVVREHHEHAVVASEAMREPERVGDAALLLLVGVLEEADPVGVAVAEQAEELARVGAPGDEHQLLDACRDDRVDGVRDHRAVVDRQQVLVRDPRQRMEAAARRLRPG